MRIRRTGWTGALAAMALFWTTSPAAPASKHEAWLGVQLREVDEATAKAFGQKEASGALIADVVKGSPAKKAGLRAGDLIVEFGGKAVKNTGDLVGRVSDLDSGASVPVKVLRGGEKVTVEVILGSHRRSRDDWEWDMDEWIQAHPKMRSFTFRFPEIWRSTTRGRLGLHVMDLNADLAEYFATKKGVLVLEVDEESPAERAGAKAGDVVTEVAGAAVANREDLTDAVEDHADDKTLKLKVLRKGKPTELTLEPYPKRHKNEDGERDDAKAGIARG